jgi:hypothetical protein
MGPSAPNCSSLSSLALRLPARAAAASSPFVRITLLTEPSKNEAGFAYIDWLGSRGPP